MIRLYIFVPLLWVLVSGSAAAVVPEWPDTFDPLLLPTLNLLMDPGDWTTIQADDTFLIEVPATFWADGETPLSVLVRRKSADPLTEDPGFTKVALKIDINAVVPGQEWHGLQKLSLETGDDQDVVIEGFSWYLQRMSSGTHGYGYRTGLASWVRLFINGVDTGVYISPEQPDKRYLENRNLFTDGETWLYKIGESQGPRVGFPPDSPTFEALCWAPFDLPGPPAPCSPPADLAVALPPLIDMAGILTHLANDAFTIDPDSMLTNAKNFYYADYLSRTRMYYPWDLDAGIPGGNTTASIYAGSGGLRGAALGAGVPRPVQPDLQ